MQFPTVSPILFHDSVENDEAYFGKGERGDLYDSGSEDNPESQGYLQ